ncbi:MAG: hypothetical protein E7409_01390 [Ruminococcaceae bacterium]|nr:hypothetical protein [Oscillospiraceae bacterium]
MSFIKRMGMILTIIVISMLVLPLVAVHTVKAEAGMLVALTFFFAVYPAISAWVGFLSGKDVKHFWFTPMVTAVLFWVFSSLTYQTAFPVVYSLIYFTVSLLSMGITALVVRKQINGVE